MKKNHRLIRDLKSVYHDPVLQRKFYFLEKCDCDIAVLVLVYVERVVLRFLNMVTYFHINRLFFLEYLKIVRGKIGKKIGYTKIKVLPLLIGNFFFKLLNKLFILKTLACVFLFLTILFNTRVEYLSSWN